MPDIVLEPAEIDELVALRDGYDRELDEIERASNGYTRFAERRRCYELVAGALDRILTAHGHPRSGPASAFARTMSPAIAAAAGVGIREGRA